jgi:hypothetical protein
VAFIPALLRSPKPHPPMHQGQDGIFRPSCHALSFQSAPRQLCGRRLPLWGSVATLVSAMGGGSQFASAFNTIKEHHR